MRAPETSSGDPLRRRESLSNFSEQDAVVCVRRSPWSKVTDRDEFVGVFSLASLFPQY